MHSLRVHDAAFWMGGSSCSYYGSTYYGSRSCILRRYLGELLDGVGLGVDGDDGHDEEDGEADDLVRVRVRVRVRVKGAGRQVTVER